MHFRTAQEAISTTNSRAEVCQTQLATVGKAIPSWQWPAMASPVMLVSISAACSRSPKDWASRWSCTAHMGCGILLCVPGRAVRTTFAAAGAAALRMVGCRPSWHQSYCCSLLPTSQGSSPSSSPRAPPHPLYMWSRWAQIRAPAGCQMPAVSGMTSIQAMFNMRHQHSSISSNSYRHVM